MLADTAASANLDFEGKTPLTKIQPLRKKLVCVEMALLHLVLCALLVSQIEMMPLDPTSATSVTKDVLMRVKRTVIGSIGCADGEVRMWPKGPCVTCEEYMDNTDTDECPS